MRQESPRFVIEVITGKPWVSGIDTTDDFPELRQLLAERYSIAFKGDGYIIHERIAEADPVDRPRSSLPNGV